MRNPFTQPITILGQTKGRGPSVQFGTYQSDRLFHTLVLGQTGTGKSTVLLNMMRQDAHVGRGFLLLDPHGDLADGIRPELSENAIFWDVADPACTYGYNPLTYIAEQYRPLAASGIIEALKMQWADAWGVRMEHLLRFALLALFSRIDQPECSRKPFIIYADEFHNFTTESDAGMLSELRKFKVGLVLFGQYLSQNSASVRDALFGNVGNIITFRCGVQDAQTLARQLELRSPTDLIGLPNYRFFCRVMIDGQQSKAFSAQSLDQLRHL